VLILAKIPRGAAGGYAEYLEGKAKASLLGDYYLKGGERCEAPGRWVQGAQQFGLDSQQPVTGEQLHQLMDVRRPDTGGQLRRVGGSGEAVAAIDATFSAPKSVSAAWALGGPKLRTEIEAAHETAVDRALTYATGQVAMLRRRVSSDTVVHEKAVGLVATSWRHTTARAVDEQVPDPQLHSHVLLHGAVRRDRKIVAIDSRSWLVHQREVGAAYRTELARELQTLGFHVRRGTGRGGRYFELDAIPQALVDRWSSRHHQVQAAIRQRLEDQQRALQATIDGGGPGAMRAAAELALLQSTGQLSPAQDRMMGTITRGAKAPVTERDLDAEWRWTGVSFGASRERIEVLRHQPVSPLGSAAGWEVLDALTEFDSTFPARDARAVALECSCGAPIQEALSRLRELRASEEILVLADETGTTRDHRGREQAVVQITERLAAGRVDALPAGLAAIETDRLDRQLADRGRGLSEEQVAAIRLATGDRPLVVIEGQAGTGKSTTLTAVARAHQSADRQIIVTSTAAMAAERLAADLDAQGVACEPYSTAGLHTAITTGRVSITDHTTIVHDEAALASTREQLHILDAVETSGARLIAVGDPKQNHPVGAGGLWNQIEQTTKAAGAHIALTANQRAQDPADRRDQAQFRAGEAEHAIRSYATRDHVHIASGRRQAEDRALEAAHADRTAGKVTTVIAQTSNDYLDQLNARAQAIHHQHRQRGSNSLSVPGRPYHLHAGDQVQIRHTINHADHGPIRNGTAAQVTGVDSRARQVELQLADGQRLWLQGTQIAEADIRLAYIQHPFPAQGQTTDTTHLIVAEHATREGTYVALTRARQNTDIYAAVEAEPEPDRDQLQQLAERLNRTEADLPSIRTPLAHEEAIHRAIEPPEHDDRSRTFQGDRREGRSNTDELALERDNDMKADLTTNPERDQHHEDAQTRQWPEHPSTKARAPERILDRLDVGLRRDDTPSFEP